MSHSFAEINWAIDQMKDDLWLAYRADDPSGHLARMKRNADRIVEWIELKNQAGGE
jgi:hypothetical protein